MAKSHGFKLAWTKSRKSYCTTREVGVSIGVGVHIYVKIFKSLYFPDHSIDLVHIWYDDRYSSKVLFGNPLPMLIPQRQGQVKVMDRILNIKDFHGF